MFVFRHALAVAGKISLALLCVALQPAGAQPTYRVVEIGALPGDTQSVPHDINDAGEVVGISGANNAFIWSAKKGMKKIATVEAPHYFWRQPATRLQINNRGSAVGPNFTWTKATDKPRYRENVCLPNGACYVGIGFGGINDNDEVSVTSMSTGYYALIHNASTNTYRDAGYNYVFPAYSYNLNNKGVFVGGMYNRRPNIAGAFVKGFINAPYPTPVGSGAQGYVSELYDINDAGAVVGQDSGYPYIYYSTGDSIYINLQGTAHAINKDGAVVGNAGGRAFIYSKALGAYYIDQIIDRSDPNFGTLTIVDARGINNNGQIIATTSTGRAVILAPAIELVDASPTFIKPDNRFETDPKKLAEAGRLVRGVISDGVSTLLIRIPAQAERQKFELSLSELICTFPSGTIVESCGGLSEVGSQAINTSVTTYAQATPQGPMAFALYKSPTDFSWDFSHSLVSERTVPIVVRSDESQFSVSVSIKRPPVMLVHGNWSDPSLWDFIDVGELDPNKRFRTYRAKYSTVMAGGVSAARWPVFGQIKDAIADFAKVENVAAAQMDIVAYSLGGLVIRDISRTDSFTEISYLKQGWVHKLITIDTPHNGSPFASNVILTPQCKWLFEGDDTPVGQNIVDMAVNSKLLGQLAAPTAKNHLLTHAVISSASDGQRARTEGIFFSGPLALPFKKLCPTLLPKGGFDQLLSPGSDLIVSLDSQSAVGLGIGGQKIPTSSLNGKFVHAVNKLLFPVGPDILGRDLDASGVMVSSPVSSSISDHIGQLLNIRVSDETKYKRIAP